MHRYIPYAIAGAVGLVLASLQGNGADPEPEPEPEPEPTPEPTPEPDEGPKLRTKIQELEAELDSRQAKIEALSKGSEADRRASTLAGIPRPDSPKVT